MLGLLPDTFYNMVPKDYYATVEGYNLKQRGAVSNLRTHAFITILPHIKEGYNYERFCREIWPVSGDVIKEVDRIVITDEELQEILKAHNLIKPIEDNG